LSVVRRRPPFLRPVPGRRGAPKATSSTGGLSTLRAGEAVILYLHSPREKVWGLLLAIDAPGVTLRCIDLAAFDDWMRQEARGDEPHLGPATIFYPMHRIERLERDETIGPVLSLSERFLREVGRTVEAVMGLS
jgi:hypothetical protein